MVALVLATIFFGVYPKPIFDVTRASTAHLVQLHQQGVAVATAGDAAMNRAHGGRTVSHPSSFLRSAAWLLLMLGVFAGDRHQPALTYLCRRAAPHCRRALWS